jgi:phosphatidylinositol glycan class W
LAGKHAKSKSKYGKLIWALAFWFIVYFALFTSFMSMIDGESGQQVSRRIANLPYIMWVVTFNFGFILAFVIIDAEFTGSGTTVPKLFDAINANGLVLFLVVRAH